MKYHFGFDRKRLIALAICLFLSGLLTFVAGVVTGIGLWTPARSELALLKKAGGAPQLAVNRPAVPAMPTVPPITPGKPTALAPAPPAPTIAAAAPPTAAPVPVSPTDAPLAAAAAMPELASPDQDAFSLQLGSFQDPKNARQLQSELRERGYSAEVFKAMDSEQKEWTVVRIRGFKTLSGASAAAADFTGKERIQALIFRSSSRSL